MNIGQLLVVGFVASVIALIVSSLRAYQRPLVVYVEVAPTRLRRRLGCGLWIVIGLVVGLLVISLQR